MKENTDIISTIKEASRECEEAYRVLYEEMREDLYFYAGMQWNEADLAKVKETHNIDATINLIFKQINSLYGRREQTLTDLRAFPVEVNDDTLSHIVSRLLKWTLDEASSQLAIGAGYKNELIAGLGFLSVWMDAENNIRISSERPLNIYIDPLCQDMLGLSDCDYIIRFKSATKSALKKAFPAMADDIEGLRDASDNLYQYDSTKRRATKLVVKEYYYRSTDTQTWIVNRDDPSDAEPWGGDEDRLTYFLTLNPHLTREQRTTDVIKIATLVGDTLLQDTIHSTGTEYPIIPLVGYYQDALEEMELKIMGHVRQLRDLQREKNARRSAMMAVTMKTPLHTVVYEEGSIKDINDIAKRGGKIGGLQYRRGANPPRVETQVGLPTSEVQLEQLLGNDLAQVGLPPEVTGSPGNIDSAKGISLIQATGLTSVAELNSHLNFALKKLGKYVIHLIRQKYSREKMQRIVGDSLPIDDAMYSAIRSDMRYDIAIDETTHSATSQMAAFESMIQQVQHGVPVPPESLIELNPFLTPDVKQRVLAQTQQAQEQARQMQMMNVLPQLPNPHQ